MSRGTPTFHMVSSTYLVSRACVYDCYRLGASRADQPNRERLNRTVCPPRDCAAAIPARFSCRLPGCTDCAPGEGSPRAVVVCAPLTVGLWNCGLGFLGPVSGQEVVDDAGAVVCGDGSQAGHSCEREWSDELAQCEIRVQAVEFSSGLNVLQDGVEGLPVLVDDPRSQRLRGMFGAGVIDCGRAQGEPGQHGDVCWGVGEQRRLSGEQFDESFAQCPTGRPGWGYL